RQTLPLRSRRAGSSFGATGSASWPTTRSCFANSPQSPPIKIQPRGRRLNGNADDRQPPVSEPPDAVFRPLRTGGEPDYLRGIVSRIASHVASAVDGRLQLQRESLRDLAQTARPRRTLAVPHTAKSGARRHRRLRRLGARYLFVDKPSRPQPR